jgi:nitrogen fixation protein NifU and related proteins
MGFLEQIYRDAVLEHARSPRNRGELDPYSVKQEGVNPSCGDELVLYLLVRDGTVAEARFTGHGCAISQASASLMTQAIRGKPLREVEQLIGRFKAMIHGRGVDPSLGDLAVLEGISKLHARVKCATLAWVTLQAAIDAEAAGERAGQVSVDDGERGEEPR